MPTPKRRWYQFSLKTMLAMMTAACVATGSTIGCRSHRHYCLEQADYHRVNARWRIIQIGDGFDAQKKEHEATSAEELRSAAFYDRALWQPWLLWSTDAPPMFVPKSE
jgi:hypothetical protein